MASEVERAEPIWARLCPRKLDNGYTGSKIALWVFAFVNLLIYFFLKLPRLFLRFL